MTYTGWQLAITEEQFDEIYVDHLHLIDKRIFSHKPDTDKEYLTFLSSKLWRMNNLYTIVDKKGKEIPFKMNWAQHKVHSIAITYPFLWILKSRQQGISTYYLVKFYDDGVTQPSLTIGLMAQGKTESKNLFTRTKVLMKKLDPAVTKFLTAGSVKDNTEEVSFQNESKILIGISFRSNTLQRLHISEFGKIANENPARAEETMTGTLQAVALGMEVAVESTAEGDNAFKHGWDEAVEVTPEERTPMDFYPVFLSWYDDPDCYLDISQSPTNESIEYFSTHEANGWTFSKEQKNWWIAKYRQIKIKIKQEYPLTPDEAFEASKGGAYWHKSFQEYGKIQSNVYDPKLPTYVIMDLGVNDTNTLVFVQIYNKTRRFVYEYGNNNQGVKHYSDKIKEWARANRTSLPTIYLPHDATKRAQTDLKTAEDFYRMYGHEVYVLERPQVKLNAINMVRDDIESNEWIVDREKCPYIRHTFTNYTREWDPKLEEWKEHPKKDYWGHWADAIIYSKIAHLPDAYIEMDRKIEQAAFKIKSFGRGGFAV